MPAKGKRVASRQAQLNRRRRRQARVAADGGAEASAREEGASAITSTTIVAPPVSVSAPAVAESSTHEYEPAPATASSAPARSGGSQNAPRAQGQARLDRSMAYTHLGAELRRILTLAGILTAILVLLSFVVPPLI